MPHSCWEAADDATARALVLFAPNQVQTVPLFGGPKGRKEAMRKTHENEGNPLGFAPGVQRADAMGGETEAA
jgi:hypothetical protein